MSRAQKKPEKPESKKSKGRYNIKIDPSVHEWAKAYTESRRGGISGYIEDLILRDCQNMDHDAGISRADEEDPSSQPKKGK